MAIGGLNYGNSSQDGGEKKKLYDNTYYSRLKVKNESEKLYLGFSFRGGNLIFEISAIKDGFQFEPIENIFISPTKALLLDIEIDKYKEYVSTAKKIDPNRAFGITSGFGDRVSYIGFHNDGNKTLVTIGKIDGNGNITNSVTIPFNTEYHYAVEWNNIESMDLEKAYDESIELTQIQYLLKDFARSMSGAMAYSVADLTRFDHKSILNKMDPIYDSLGIERRTYNNSNYGKQNNFLNNAKSTSNHTSYDDIELALEDE